MADSSYAQSDFSGGEWSTFAQGRFSDPKYETALAKSFNAYTGPERGWHRRQGTKRLWNTPFAYDWVDHVTRSDGTPIIMTAGALTGGLTKGGVHLFAPQGLNPRVNFDNGTAPHLSPNQFWPTVDNWQKITGIAGVSGGLLTFTVGSTSGFGSGSLVVFSPHGGAVTMDTYPELRNYLFQLVDPDGVHFNIQDPITGRLVHGPLTTGQGFGGTEFFWVGHIHNLAGPYFGPSYAESTPRARVKTMKMLQAPTNTAYFFSKMAPPWLLNFNTNNQVTSPITFQPAGLASDNVVGTVTHVDGPYDDPLSGNSQTGNSLGSLTGSFPNYVFQVTDSAYSFVGNNGYIGQDVGRLIRIWNQPPAWAGATSYNVGDRVTYQQGFYECQIAGSAHPPGTIIDNGNGVIMPKWFPVIQAASWCFGVITSITNSTTVAVQLSPAFNIDPFLTKNGAVCDTWQLGLMKGINQEQSEFGVAIDGTFPSCGMWYEGRLILGGTKPNRFDMSMATGPSVNTDTPIMSISGNQTSLPIPLFSPTDQFGNVFDDMAIVEVMNAPDQEVAQWMVTDHNGIILGTLESEWWIFASALTDPITPTSIQSHRVSKFGSRFSTPVFCGLSHIFIQRYGLDVYELLVDAFSQRFVGRPINELALHLTRAGAIGVTYIETPVPTVWVVMQDGSIASCLYRRKSYFASEDPIYMAWSSHQLGLGSLFNVYDCTNVAFQQQNGQSIFTLQNSFGTEIVSDKTSNVFFDPVFPPGKDARAEVLAMVGVDSSAQGFVEVMAPRFADGQAAYEATCLDSYLTGGNFNQNDNSFAAPTVGGVIYTAAQNTSGPFAGQAGIQFWGLRQFANNPNPVRAFLMGIDCGLQTVDHNGAVFIPWGAVPGFTLAAVQQWTNFNAASSDYIPIGYPFRTGETQTAVAYYIPGIFGFDYISQGTLMRPQSQNQLHTPTGPGVGKRRRTHMVAAHVANCSNISFSIDGNTYVPIDFTLPDFGGSVGSPNTPYTGIVWTTINSNANFDSAISWQMSGPYPGSVLAVEGFLNAEDR